MTPARYLQLRREAAALTIEQVASRFIHRPDQKASVEANCRAFETAGVVIKPWVLEDLARAFRFDPGIYRMLADEPADRHPMLCATCGWDEWSEGIDLDGNDIRWIEPGHCSRCEQLAERARTRAASTGQLL